MCKLLAKTPSLFIVMATKEGPSYRISYCGKKANDIVIIISQCGFYTYHDAEVTQPIGL